MIDSKRSSSGAAHFAIDHDASFTSGDFASCAVVALANASSDASASPTIASCSALAPRRSAASGKRTEDGPPAVIHAIGSSFKITNPNEPAKVRALSVQQLKSKLDAGGIELFDVRTPRERELAQIEGARLLDRAAQDHIMSLPKDTPLYFHCHHGVRSQQAAEFFLNQGFNEVYNVEGGIDAWSREVDSDVPRYE